MENALIVIKYRSELIFLSICKERDQLQDYNQDGFSCQNN